jgi:hypothetical protein
VRRAFLCGSDSVSGQSFEHRRQWIEDKLYELCRVFALDLCAYAVMSNHYHVVLYVDADQAENWSRYAVITRWHQLFNGTLFSQRHMRGEALTKLELKVLDKDVATWRQRLMDISWFMRVLNESIARQANAEDNCTGRFWPLPTSCLPRHLYLPTHRGGALSPRPCWMKRPSPPAWLMSI